MTIRPLPTAHVTAELRSLSGEGTPYEAECLVDTGAVDCMAPADRLRAAGIKPEGKAAYDLAVDPVTETLKRLPAKPLK